MTRGRGASSLTEQLRTGQKAASGFTQAEAASRAIRGHQMIEASKGGLPMRFRTDGAFAGRPRMKVCFLFNAQRHQLLHGIGAAFRLARDPAFEVTVMSPSQGHLDYARQLCTRWGEDRIVYRCVRSPLLAAVWDRVGGAVPPKLLTLTVLAPLLNGFDAVAVPERTSISLKMMGVRQPSFIHLDHGAGDRAAGFDPRIRRFDFVLMAGEKHRARLLREGLIRAGAHAMVGYPKFEAADAARDPAWEPFPGDPRPIVLYNPHFSTLGSWHRLGGAVLDAFARQDRYNLILAPHVRLLDGTAARERWAALLDRYSGNPHILIDPGSDRSIDMSYTMAADIYLGDVSSQVYEFLRVPRPCLFLDAAGIDWKDDENYAHWHFGPVVTSANGLIEAVDHARESHPSFVAQQKAAFEATFGDSPVLPAERAAAAIASHLRQRRRLAEARRRGRRAWMKKRLQRVAAAGRRAVLIVPAVIGGWLLHDLTEPTPIAAAHTSFVDEAVASHEILLLRDVMRSQRETPDFQPDEILAMTGIAMPRLPADWRILDVQIFPSDVGPSVQLLIRTQEGMRFTMVATRRVDTPAEGRPLLERRRGERIAFWEERGTAFALVGRQSPARLFAMASLIASEAP